MLATVMYGAGDVRVEQVPDPAILEPTDAIVRVEVAAVCGTDLWPYRSMEATSRGDRMGHEFVGVVEEVGSEVRDLAPGHLVVAPFSWSDGSCRWCRAGLSSSCVKGGFWGGEHDGGQGEAVRVPHASATLVRVPGTGAGAELASLLTLSDVFCTGHHAAVTGGVGPASTVTVVGDGAVGLAAVLASARLGAERIVLVGHHGERVALGRELGAAEVVTASGEEAVHLARERGVDGGADTVLECVGTREAVVTALALVRDGGVVSRVGAAQYAELPLDSNTMMRNLTLTGGLTPVRAYIEELLPDVLTGAVDPGRLFDRTVSLTDVPDAYRAMHDREALKVLARL